MSPRAAAEASRDLAVILAGAGEGRRMGDAGPKLLISIGGSPLIERVAEAFLSHRAVGELVAVVPARLLDRCRTLLAVLARPGRVRMEVIAGGTTRQESVRLGIAALALELPYIAVHDVARALVGQDLISRVLAAARRAGGAIPALPLRDTVKEVEGERVLRTVPRERLQSAQTPQIFERGILARAHALAFHEGTEATDEAALVELLRAPVAVVPGEPSNLKLTEPADVMLLEYYLRAGTSP